MEAKYRLPASRGPRPAPGAFGRNPGMLNKKQIETFFARLQEANPNPRGELDYINPYTLLVAVVLSAQATDASVNKATEPLFKVADTPQKMLALGEKKLREFIRTIG